MEKRICLLAGGDNRSTMQDYALYIARKLSKMSDLYYFADARLSEKELNKIRPYAKYAASFGHRSSDFGSWQCLFNHLGFSFIKNCERLIVCNDTIYGPLNNLEDIFAYMDMNDYDFWGLKESYHSTYHRDGFFFVFQKDVICHPKFQQFWQTMKPVKGICSYESDLIAFLTELGFKGVRYTKNYQKDDVLNYPLYLLNLKKEAPQNFEAPFNQRKWRFDTRFENEKQDKTIFSQ